MAYYSETQSNPLVRTDLGRLARGGYRWLSNKQINIGFQPSAGGGGSSGDGFGFKITVTGQESFIRIMNGFGLFEKYLQGNEMMTPAVRAFGIAWRRNFALEGALSGKNWAPLSQSTIAKRTERGFGSGPILRQSGSLWAGAIEPVSGWTVAHGNFTKVVNPSANDGTSGGAVVTYSVSGKQFRIAISGPKAEHMQGSYQLLTGGDVGPNTRYAGSLALQHMASRPFWYVTGALEKESAELTKKFMVGRLGLFLPGAGAGNVFYRPSVTAYSKMTGG